jgi:hypothetical protein
MRYRILDANGDYTFGQGSANFYVDEPAAPAQAVLTRLKLFTNEWFLDLTDGTPWVPGPNPGDPGVVGMGTAGIRDQVIQQRIAGTPGILRIVRYTSSLDHRSRVFTVSAVLDTIFGPIARSWPLSLYPPAGATQGEPFTLGGPQTGSPLDGQDYLRLGFSEPVGPITAPPIVPGVTFTLDQSVLDGSDTLA